MDFGFDAPVIAHVGEGGVFVEETAVPATHFVVGYYVAVLDVLFFEHEGGFFEEGGVYPGGDVPMFFGDEFYGETTLAHEIKKLPRGKMYHNNISLL
jgi:hypothetical protein